LTGFSLVATLPAPCRGCIDYLNRFAYLITAPPPAPDGCAAPCRCCPLSITLSEFEIQCFAGASSPGSHPRKRGPCSALRRRRLWHVTGASQPFAGTAAGDLSRTGRLRRTVSGYPLRQTYDVHSSALFADGDPSRKRPAAPV